MRQSFMNRPNVFQKTCWIVFKKQSDRQFCWPVSFQPDRTFCTQNDLAKWDEQIEQAETSTVHQCSRQGVIDYNMALKPLSTSGPGCGALTGLLIVCWWSWYRKWCVTAVKGLIITALMSWCVQCWRQLEPSLLFLISSQLLSCEWSNH